MGRSSAIKPLNTSGLRLRDPLLLHAFTIEHEKPRIKSYFDEVRSNYLQK